MSREEACPICQNPIQIKREKPLTGEKDTLKYLEHFRDKKQEYFICLSLGSGLRLITWRVVTIGTLDMAIAHPREIFARIGQHQSSLRITTHREKLARATQTSKQPSKSWLPDRY
jgi:DNA repair protein RadC